LSFFSSAIGLGQGFLAHAGGLDLLLHLVDVGAVLAFAEFLLDGLDLLVQVVLALALLHLALDAAADALFDLQDVELGLELAEQLFQALGDAEDLEHLLLLLQLERQVGGNGVGQAPGFLDAGQRGQDLGRNLLVQLHVLVELGQHACGAWPRSRCRCAPRPASGRRRQRTGRAGPRCAAGGRAARLRPAP
jgi:hypothetical protein